VGSRSIRSISDVAARAHQRGRGEGAGRAGADDRDSRVAHHAGGALVGAAHVEEARS
jgi:hypothetical protein